MRASTLVASLTATIVLLPACKDHDPAPGDKGPPAVTAAAKAAPAPAAQLLPPLAKLAETLPAGFAEIPQERKDQLEKLALFIRSKINAGETARVTYICTHNSRRSHMGQLFGTLAAAYYGVDHFEAFSGGTEATAFNPRAVAAVERLGFTLANPGGDNPHYKATYAANRPPLEMFSKKYDDPFNPKDNFATVMTCAHADKNCPVVAGASLRIPLHYEDPKDSDGKPDETATYDARAKQIATEAFYAFSRVKG
jgi:arsenate reductase